MDITHEKLDRARRQRLLRNNMGGGGARGEHRHSRPLQLGDQGLSFCVETWINADIGDEGTMEYKNGRMEDNMTWNMPAALLMTVSFGFTFAVTNDVVQSTPLGYVLTSFTVVE